MDKTIKIYATQIIFVAAILFGYQGLSINNVNEWGIIVARYVFYMLLIRGLHELCSQLYSVIESQQPPDPWAIMHNSKNIIYLFLASVTVILYNKQKVLDEDFLLWFIAHLITSYLGRPPPVISYGVSMAYSYFKGYLMHVIPSDGASIVGFDENLEQYSAKHGVVFPVKKMFIIIPKSLYCPPDLKQFNKKNREDLPYLEACQPLAVVEKDVAGTKNRKYHLSVYKIHRPGKQPVYQTVDGATPMRTLHNVLQWSEFEEKLVPADIAGVINDFCQMLTKMIERSPECRGKCQLVYFDDTDPRQNLADVLLDQIRLIEPNFEKIMNE